LKKITLATIACIVLTIFIPIAVPAMAANPTPFTGDVEADFTGPGILTIPDPLGDVGYPNPSPGGKIPAPGMPGWDMKDFRITYDSGTDTLYVGLNSGGIAGDADGDGDPSHTSLYLADMGGTDYADFGTSESFAVYFDFDQDGTLDVIAGVSASVDISGYTVAYPLSNPGSPATNFGATIPGATGTVTGGTIAEPDVEFSILNFSTLPGQDGDGRCDINAFMGSLGDDGIGEDFIDFKIDASTITTITSSADSVVTGGTVDLTITEVNDGSSNLTDPQVVVTQQGSTIATLTSPGPAGGDDDNDGELDVGENWTWTITSDPITDDPTTFVAVGTGICPADIPITYPGDPEERDEIVIDELFPSTITTIEADPPGPVVIGATVDLTVTEENDGEVDLTNPYVEVKQEGALIATLTAAPDSGDDGDGVLEIGETWSWTITSNVVTVDPTTFEATGYGTDPLGREVTYETGYTEERDSVDVGVLMPSTITTIISSDSAVLPNETVDLTVTEENDGEVDLTNPYVEVTQQGAMLATLVAAPDSGDDGDGVLEVGETWSWTITSNVITVDPTIFVATGYGTDPIGNVVTYPDDQQERDTVQVELIVPSTMVDISASSYQVIPGSPVNLTITEKNDGDTELHDVQVVVDNGTATIATFGAPPESGDMDTDNILDPGETWMWTINGYVVNATTVFTVTGSALDPDNNVITYPDDQEERDSVTVYARPPVVGGDVYTESIAGILMPWVSIFGIVVVASVLVLQRKKWLLR